MAGDTKEVDALLVPLNRSAERLQTLWFSFLAVTLYIAVSAFTTTHRMLLLGEGQTLPILNVKLPLLPFYIVAPAFYVVMHAYLLMMLILLARTAGSFEDALERAAFGGMTKKDRERYRMRLENSIFLQIVAGAERERQGANGWILRAIALISLAATPVLVLLLFQLMFLPYHSEAITWLHRVLVVIDIVLIWTLWPSYRFEAGNRMWPSIRSKWALATRSLVSLLVIAFSTAFATFPTEDIHDNPLAAAVPDAVRSYLFGRVDADVYLLFGVPGIFPTRLWLPNETLVDIDALKKLEVASRFDKQERPVFIFDLSHRDLTEANLANADLRRVTFQGENTDLRRANLAGAWLQNASLAGAQLQGASLSFAQLQGAEMSGAHLEDAALMEAQLQGSKLAGAKLQGAMLGRANFEGAYLDSALFQGSYARGARFHGASLQKANFQGAELAMAEFQGALLDEALFRGARLYNTQLQGASLSQARFEGAQFSSVAVWRTLGHSKMPTTGEVKGFNQLESYLTLQQNERQRQRSFAAWQDDILNEIPASARNEVRERLSILDPALADPDNGLGRDFWDRLEQRQVDRAAEARRREAIACADEYAARGIIRYFGFGDAAWIDLADKLLIARQSKPDACPAARRLRVSDLRDFCRLKGGHKHPLCEDFR